MKSFVLLKTSALLIAIAAIIAPAARASNIEPTSETVHFADLNVASPEGAAMLFKRIRAAAQEVCRDLDAGYFDLALMQRHEACVRNAIGSAVEQVGTPVLRGYAAAQGIGAPTASLARNP